MFGVPIAGPVQIFLDNESVVKCTSNVETKLKKKHESILYYKIKFAIASDIVTVYYEQSGTNIADLLTKVLPKHKRVKLFKCIFN